MSGTGCVLLLSGGIDSACLACWLRPEWTLTVDYGQVTARGEATAARAVADELSLDNELIEIAWPISAGLLAGKVPEPGSPSPEWWPFRNQLLVTLAAAWAVCHEGVGRVMVGSVAPDGERHADGTRAFYELLGSAIAYQEGAIAIETPAIGLTTGGLIAVSGATDRVLRWTHSCHNGSLACGRCPGCFKRKASLAEAGRLQI